MPSSGGSAVTADRIQSHGLDVAKALGAKGTGSSGRRSRTARSIPEREALRAAACARRSCRSPTSGSRSRTVRRTRWSSSRVSTTARRSPARRCRSSGATTACSGPAPPAPTASRRSGVRIGAPLRGRRRLASGRVRISWSLAEKDGDIAYVGSNWNEGIEPWDFGMPFNLRRGGAAAARHGLQRSRRLPPRRRSPLQGDPPPEHAERHSAAAQPARRSSSSLRDSQDRVVDERTVKVNAWSSAEWTLTLPAEGALGNYSVRAMLESDKPKPKTAEAGASRATRRARSRRRGAVPEGGERLVPGRRLPAPGLPRRRDAHGRRARSRASRSRAS